MKSNPGNASVTTRRFAVLLGLALVAVYAENILGISSFYRRDFGELGYTVLVYLRTSLAGGEVPSWNPYSHLGVPFLAQWGTLCCYPGSILWVLLPLPWSLNLFCVLHLWLGGVSMFLLARRWTGTAWGAAVAAVCYTSNGITQSCVEWANYCAALAWMPLVVLLAESAWIKGGRDVVKAALACSMLLLLGTPEIVMMTGTAVALIWLTCHRQSLLDPADVVSEPGVLRTGRRLVAVGLLGFMLAAVQLLPFLDLLAESHRTVGPPGSKWSMSPSGTLNWVLPLLGCRLRADGVYENSVQGFFSSTYLGLGLLALATAGVIAKPTRRAWLLAGLAGLGAALAMGEDGPAFALARSISPYAVIPRYPAKFLLLGAWSLSLLASYALTSSEPAGAKRRLPIVGVCILLVLVWDVPFARWDLLPPGFWANGLQRVVFSVVIIGLWLGLRRAIRDRPHTQVRTSVSLLLGLLITLWLDFRTHMPGLNPKVPAEQLAGGAPTLEAGPVAWEAGRLFCSGAAFDVHRDKLPAAYIAQAALRRRSGLGNLNLLDGIMSTSGSMTLKLRRQYEIEARLRASPDASALPLLDFLGVNWTLSATNLGQWDPRPGAMPLVTAGQRAVYLGEAETLTNVLSASFQPREEAYLLPEAAALKLPETRANATVTNILWERQSVAFDVTTDAPTLAMVSQTWHRWWRARVDGTNAPVLRANYAFQAVPVPAGQHRVVLEYVDRPFQVGAVISGLSLLLCGWIWFRYPPRSRGEAAAAGGGVQPRMDADERGGRPGDVRPVAAGGRPR